MSGSLQLVYVSSTYAKTRISTRVRNMQQKINVIYEFSTENFENRSVSVRFSTSRFSPTKPPTRVAARPTVLSGTHYGPRPAALRAEQSVLSPTGLLHKGRFRRSRPVPASA